MRVTIAAQACLLVLNRRGESFANLRQILVYPGPFAVDKVHADGSGVLQEQRHALAGESWTLGQVVLSWEDALAGAESPDDGRNVVIHEFAHQLDQENGRANGAPPMAGKARTGPLGAGARRRIRGPAGRPRATVDLCFSVHMVRAARPSSSPSSRRFSSSSRGRWPQGTRRSTGC